MRTQSLTLDGVTLGICEGRGNGHPVVLFHGNSLASELFREQLDDAALAMWHLLAVDCPGHGLSEDAPSCYGFWNLVDVLVRAIAALDLVRPVLVGHSMGGHLCFQLAARLPSVCGVFVQGTPPFDGPNAIQRAFLPHPHAGNLFVEQVSDDAVRAVARAVLSPEHPAVGRVESALARSDGRARAKLAEGMVQGVPNELALIRSLACPVAVVHAENDVLVSRAYMDALPVDHFWGGCVHLLQGASHCGHLDQPAGYNRLLASFLSDVTTR
jgi:pimeloyl-ACP methyl ester carboxylesterase